MIKPKPFGKEFWKLIFILGWFVFMFVAIFVMILKVWHEPIIPGSHP